MKAAVHLFNVGHGDSAVVELVDGDKKAYIVIDCNVVGEGEAAINRAYEFLKKKNVKVLDALVVTHLHRDHYTGIEDFLNFQIEKIIIPPFLSQNSETINKRVHALKNKIIELVERGPDALIGRQALSLAALIEYMSSNEDKVFEAVGPSQELRIKSFTHPIGKILLPLAKIKGLIGQAIESGDYELDTFKQMNDSSVVLSLEIGEQRVVLGGDATRSQWLEHKRVMARDSVDTIGATALKVPHHGSKYDNVKETYSYIFDKSEGRFACVSANGKHHPDDEFFALATEAKLQPYCTNLAGQCVGESVVNISGVLKLKKEFRTFAVNYEFEDPPTSCQGDITLEIDASGIKIFNSTGNGCIYRPGQTPAVQKLI
jgi:beta-lactamase superfamily II metal-dependent hydrolase